MWRYILWKTTLSIVALFLATAIIYFAYVSIKGNPYASQAESLDPAAYQAKLEAAGINDPIYVRYFNWLGGIFSGSFGRIYTQDQDMTIPEKFFPPYKTSMLVSLPAFFIGMFLGLGLGTWAGYKRGKLTDQIINGFVIFFVAVPVFVIAALAVIIGPQVDLPTLFEENAGTSYMIKTLILPIMVSVLISLASWSRIMRMEVANILSSDYILAARTKGYSEWFIFRRYVLRNALYPFVSAIVYAFMAVFASSIIIERFFNIGGTSSFMMTAISSGEVDLVMFQTLFLLALGIFLQLISDIAQFMINPLVKANFSSKTSPLAKIKFAMLRNKNAKLEAAAEGGKND